MLQIFRSFLIPTANAMDESSSKSQVHIPSTKTTMEFAVQMSCQNCVKHIHTRLSEFKDISNIQISLEKESVVVETTLTSSEIKKIIEDTGKKVVLKGIGGISESDHLGAAVAVVGSTDPGNHGFGWGSSPVCGVIRFIQANEKECIIEGTLDGLSPGSHGIHVYECGDISRGCDSIGGHYNPLNSRHGSPESSENDRHVGDLGNIVADENGRASFRIVDHLVKTWDIIGRSFAVTEKEDDLGKGGTNNSDIDGNSGNRLACGIIARSAGLFENPKRICACDGITLWDEVSERSKERESNGLKTLMKNERSSDTSQNQKSKY